MLFFVTAAERAVSHAIAELSGDECRDGDRAVRDGRPTVRLVRTTIAASVAVLVSAQTAMATWSPWWTASTDTTAYVCCYGWHEAGDAFKMKATFSWTATNAQNMRNNRSEGHYFTIDINDLSHNVESYGIATSVPNPYFDWDDDNNDEKYEQAETVSEASGWPPANVSYYDAAFFSHSFIYHLHGFETWGYDPDGGTVEFQESLSWLCGTIFCEKYETYACCAQIPPNRTYPFNGQGLAAGSGSGGAEAVSAVASLAGPVLPSAPPYTITIRDGGVDLHAVLTDGLTQYVRAAHGLAIATLRGGPAEGIATFSRPLSWQELTGIESSGLRLLDVEAVSSQGSDGLRSTFYGEYSPGMRGVIDALAADEGETLLGFVSARVSVPDSLALTSALQSGLVYLVDLSITDYQRHNPDVSDISQNDVFWALAGWD